MSKSTALYPPVRQKLVQALQDVFDKGFFSDQVLEHYFKHNRKWGSRDRKAFANYLYGIVRWIRPLLKAEGVAWSEGWNPKNEIIAEFTGLKGLDVNVWEAVIDRYAQKTESLERLSYYEEFDEPTLRYSLSDFTLKLFEAELEGEVEEELKALNQSAPVYLRANSLKASVKDVQKRLSFEDIETQMVPGVPTALLLGERKAIFKTEAFKNGLFEMQDAGSQCIGEFVEVEPGFKVVDACAGAGGKSLHLAALMQNKGRLISMDIHAHKLQELLRRARRAGVSNLETRVIDSTKQIKRLAGSADRLLLDVPCTGSGVLRRNPDSKWRISPYECEALKAEQSKILEHYSSMVKPGGKMIYSTCSLLASENRQRVEAFLNSEAGQSFELEAEQSIRPSSTGFDGFYMARVKRK